MSEQKVLLETETHFFVGFYKVSADKSIVLLKVRKILCKDDFYFLGEEFLFKLRQNFQSRVTRTFCLLLFDGKAVKIGRQFFDDYFFGIGPLGTLVVDIVIHLQSKSQNA